jgi:hypothetical protein
MRSMVEGFFPDSAEPLHRASRGPPPPEIRGRNFPRFSAVSLPPLRGVGGGT